MNKESWNIKCNALLVFHLYRTKTRIHKSLPSLSPQTLIAWKQKASFKKSNIIFKGMKTRILRAIMLLIKISPIQFHDDCSLWPPAPFSYFTSWQTWPSLPFFSVSIGMIEPLVITLTLSMVWFKDKDITELSQWLCSRTFLLDC